MALSYSTGLVHSILGSAGLAGSFPLGFVIDVYSGTRPATADAAVVVNTTTKLLGTITAASAAALHFGAPALRAVDKDSTETWSFTAIDTLKAVWFRVRTAAEDGIAASDVLFRIDGSVSITSDLVLSDTNIVSGNTYTLNKFKLSWGV
jgi:hypothetical protein